MNVDALTVPIRTVNQDGTIKAGDVAFKDMNDQVLTQILTEAPPANADEATFLTSGIELLEHSVVVLRATEGLIQGYQNLIDACQSALTEIGGQSDRLAQRLDVVNRDLGEARHDVAAARALLAEETARVDAVNKRRSQVLDQHVTFYVYQRLRTASVLRDTPSRPVNPAAAQAPVPACLASPKPSPPELTAFLDLFRKSPSNWFINIPPLLDRFDDLDIFRRLLITSRQRSLIAYQPPPIAIPNRGGAFAIPVLNVINAQAQAMESVRQAVAQIDLAGVAGWNWTYLRGQAEQVVTLGDLLDGAHGRPDVSRQATQEFQSLSRVAACLYAHAADVPPTIRLDWAVRLDRYDAPIDLRDLTQLPRWAEVDYLTRQSMLTLSDWLFSRVSATQSGAVALVNDLVRVALLLASHAPVNQILAGQVESQTVAAAGDRLTLVADNTRLRIGMVTQVYNGNTVVARGLVEDLFDGRAVARVTDAGGRSVRFEAGTRVQFLDSAGA
jgi:hypothetical protein